MTTFGERLRAAMIVRGIAKQNIRAHMNISRVTLNTWLTMEKADMRARALLRLAKYLHVRVHWLAWGKGPMLHSDLVSVKTMQ